MSACVAAAAAAPPRLLVQLGELGERLIEGRRRDLCDVGALRLLVVEVLVPGIGCDCMSLQFCPGLLTIVDLVEYSTPRS